MGRVMMMKGGVTLASFTRGVHSGHHCIGQKVQMYMFSLQEQGDFEALVDLQHDMVVKAFLLWQEAMYGGLLRYFRRHAHMRRKAILITIDVWWQACGNTQMSVMLYMV